MYNTELIKVGCQAVQVAMTLPSELPIWEESLEVQREDVEDLT